MADANGRCLVHGCEDDGVSQFGRGILEKLRSQGASAAEHGFLAYSPASYATVLCNLLEQLGLSPEGVQNAYHQARVSLSAATVTQSIGEEIEAEEIGFSNVKQTVVVNATSQVVPWDAVVATFRDLVGSGCSEAKWIILHGMGQGCPIREIQNILRGAVWQVALAASSLRVVWCEESESAPQWADAGECYRLGSIGMREAQTALQSAPASLSQEQAEAVARQLPGDSSTLTYTALERAVSNEILRRSWTEV